MDPADARLLGIAQGPGARVYQAARDLTVHEGDIFQVVERDHLVPVPGTATAQLVDQLLVAFQPPTIYPGLLARDRSRSWVSVIGSAGSGKSTFLASLVRHELTGGGLSEPYAHAIVFCDAATNAQSLGLELFAQLSRSVPGYTRAYGHARTADHDAFDDYPALERFVALPLADLFTDPLHHEQPTPPAETAAIETAPAAPAGTSPVTSSSTPGPRSSGERASVVPAPVSDGREVLDLRNRSVPQTVRLVVDGLDQLRPDDAKEVLAGLATLAVDERLIRLRVIAGHRDADLDGAPSGRGVLKVEAGATAEIARYLQARQLPRDIARELADLCVRADSSWLAARLLADVHSTLSPAQRREVERLLGDPYSRTTLIGRLYNYRLAQLPDWRDEDVDYSTGRNRAWHRRYRPVLTALVAAGSGPVAPLPLLAAVSAQFGGPDSVDGVRAVLDDLGRLVVRVHVETDDELARLFHPTLVEHLSQDRFDDAGRSIDSTSGLRVLLEAIDQLAPVTGLYVSNPLYRWAAEAQAEHYWQLGLHDRALTTLRRRPLPTPATNLARWAAWLPRITRQFGARQHHTLSTREVIAHWTGETGHRKQALSLYQELLPDRVKALGARHPDALSTRANIAYWTGQSGHRVQALQLYQELLADQVEVLGARHPNTLTTHSNIAGLAGATGRPEQALRLYQELLPDRVEILGPRHPDTLTTRANIATWTGQTGHPEQALRLYQKLLPDQVEVLGDRHPDTLATRSRIASWTGQSGHPEQALRLYQELLPDRVEILGAQHPDTLITRSNIASWTGQSGHPEQALRLCQELLPDQVEVLGAQHPDTLATRSNIATWTGETGHPEQALRLCQALLPDQIEVLGAQHPDTLAARANIVALTEQDESE